MKKNLILPAFVSPKVAGAATHDGQKETLRPYGLLFGVFQVVQDGLRNYVLAIAWLKMKASAQYFVGSTQLPQAKGKDSGHTTVAVNPEGRPDPSDRALPLLYSRRSFLGNSPAHFDRPAR